MTSNGHVIGGLSVAIALCDVVARTPLITFAPFRDMYEPIAANPFMAFVAMGLFAFGTLLPDCDSERSALGRYVHVQVEHRTWTHSLWVPAILLGVLYFWQGHTWSLWLVFGYLVHLMLDSWSKMGVCWFYPYPGFREYASGARVKRHRGRRLMSLYKTGTSSEAAVLAVLVTLCVMVLILCHVFGGIHPYFGELPPSDVLATLRQLAQ